MRNKIIFFLLILLIFLFPCFSKAGLQFLNLPFLNKNPQVLQGWYYNDGSLHKGIDYPCTKGENIYAAADGIAMSSFQSGDYAYGNFVLINHQNGYFTLYGHLDSIENKIKNYSSNQRNNQNYEEWTPIKKGEIVGKCGNSGTQAVHLHFELSTGYAIGKMDPYDIYKTAIYYPPIGLEFAGLGENQFWSSETLAVIFPSLSSQSSQNSSLPEGLTSSEENLSFWDKIAFYWNGFVANVKDLFGGSTGEVQVAKPLSESDIQEQTNQEISSPAARNDNGETTTQQPTENSSSPSQSSETWDQKFISYKLDEQDKVNGIYKLTLNFQNTGNTTWTKDDVSLNIVGGNNGTAAKFYHPSWITRLRPAKVDTTTQPGNIASFTFLLQFPKEPGAYYPQFRPVRYIKDTNSFSWIGSDKAIFLAEVKESSPNNLTFAGASLYEITKAAAQENNQETTQTQNNSSSPNSSSSNSSSPTSPSSPSSQNSPSPVDTSSSPEENTSPQDDQNTQPSAPPSENESEKEKQEEIFPSIPKHLTFDDDSFTFDWEDINQTTYILEIDDKDNFDEPILLTKELNESQYTLTLNEIRNLGSGNYFWRIKTKSGDKESSSEIFSFVVPSSIKVVLKGELIQLAVDAANHGDTIIVDDGTYKENIKISKNNLILKSKNGSEKTIVEAADSSDHIFEITGNNIEISGFTIKGATGKAGIYISDKENCKIFNNVVENNYYGIELYKGSGSVVENNIIKNNLKHGIYLTNGGSGHKIQGNTIINNENGIYLTSAVEANSIKINFNNIFSNSSYGINNTSSNSLDATNNWWGDSSGPYHQTLNPSATGNTVSSNINFIPWLDAPYPSGKSRSFNAFIDSNKNGEYDEGELTFYTIQKAVDAASSGNTIIVDNGNYKENIKINKSSLTIKSKNEANNTTIKALKSERYNYIFEITANNVEINGFTIKDAIGIWCAGIYITGNQGTKIYNNIFKNNYISIWGVAAEQLIIENNSFSEPAKNIYGGVYLAKANDSVVQKNTFNSVSNIIIGGSNYVIDNNNFISSSLELGGTSIQLENCNFENGGVLISQGAYNIDFKTVKNTYINGKPLFYLKGASDFTFTENDYGQIILVGCSNIEIQGLEISNTIAGVQLINSTQNKILNNIFNNNDYGVYIMYSSYNKIDENTIFAKKSGIYLNNYSSNNEITTNNILYSSNSDSDAGIFLDNSSNQNTIDGNTIDGKGVGHIGIKISSSSGNIIKGNTTSNSDIGLYLYYATNNYIYNNNFINNKESIHMGAGNSGNVWQAPE